jgi:hypothetical protein
MTLLTNIAIGSPFGPLQQTFQFGLEDGSSALLGANNSGKSAILQLIFRSLLGQGQFGPDRICLILADPPHLAPTTETGGRTLATYNQELGSQISANNLLGYSTYSQPMREELARLLLNHTNFHHQLNKLETLLDRLSMPALTLRANQAVHFGDVAGYFQGSGLRNAFPILAALTDPEMRVIMIDEPEISLEPTLQKALKLKNRDAIASFQRRYLEPASLLNLIGPSSTPYRPRGSSADLANPPGARLPVSREVSGGRARCGGGGKPG